MEFKLLYVVGFFLVGTALSRLHHLIPSGVLADVIQFGMVWYGSRVFRAQGEPVEPRRVWWRMTSWRTASGWLGLSSAVAFVVNPVNTFVATLDPGAHGAFRYTPLELASVSVYNFVVGFLYLNSWARLRRAGIVKPPRPPARPAGLPKPPVKLD